MTSINYYLITSICSCSDAYVLNVNSEGVLRNDRYILNTNDKWILNSIRFDEHVSSSQNFLVGNIWSYSTYEQEDERPSKIFLFEKKTDTLSPLPIIDKVNLQASPNPFIDELIIRFDLNKKSICRLTLSDISGKLFVKTYGSQICANLRKAFLISL